MKALVFEYKLSRLAVSKILGTFYTRGYLSRFGFLKLKEISYPRLYSNSWLTVKTKFCGICGSDHKQIFLDGNRDNPMTALISWPQVLGHEAVGLVDKADKAGKLSKGERIVLNPWINCIPREISPICEACNKGNYYLCKNFRKGNISQGIHTGNSRDVTGGFAEYFPAHHSMAIKIPDNISWEQAVLSDPFSVALHSILKADLEPGFVCAVYGCGNLGLLTILILKKLFTDIFVIAIAKFKHQSEMAKKFGADLVLKSDPVNKIIEKVADYLQCDIYYLRRNKPWLIEGVDILFDTVASHETFEIGLRITKASNSRIHSKSKRSGKIIFTGVSSPKRFEWTPWYFKEIMVIGSNAFGYETFEGKDQHAYYHYFDAIKNGTLDPSCMITHKFNLSNYKKTLMVARKQAKHKSIKVLFKYNDSDDESIK
jgi:threonine dehydrogenase-like Zn-dependent dehydrogenase